MGLLNFLYKDAYTISSLSAQIFKGRLASVATETSSVQKQFSEISGSIKLVSGKSYSGNDHTETHKEVIDPHDSAVLDIIAHLQNYVVDIEKASSGDIVCFSCDAVFISYEQRKMQLEYGFDMNEKGFQHTLSGEIKEKKHRDGMIKHVKNECIGNKTDIQAFLRTGTGKWLSATMQEAETSIHLRMLQTTYGADFIPVTVMGVFLGDVNIESPEDQCFGMARSIQQMKAMCNNIISTGAQIAGTLIPVVIMQEIHAEHFSSDGTD